MYVLEGVTPCIQSMQLQAGDTVTFSRMDPEGKLLMGFRKASNNILMQWLCGHAKRDGDINSLRNESRNEVKMFGFDEEVIIQIPIQAQSLLEGSREGAVLISEYKPSVDVDYLEEDCFYDLPYNTGYQISVLYLRKTRDEIMKCTLFIYVDIYFN